ncbi:MAG TPA: hypothetical protein VGL61_17450 [Kofleriaceae bacterium]|jgi:hypothetical protein
MAIDVQIHGNDPKALAEVIRDSIEDSGLVAREAGVANLSILVAREEDEGARRRAAWRWLNRPIDHDNDWSDV